MKKLKNDDDFIYRLEECKEAQIKNE